MNKPSRFQEIATALVIIIVLVVLYEVFKPTAVEFIPQDNPIVETPTPSPLPSPSSNPANNLWKE